MNRQFLSGTTAYDQVYALSVTQQTFYFPVPLSANFGPSSHCILVHTERWSTEQLLITKCCFQKYSATFDLDDV